MEENTSWKLLFSLTAQWDYEQKTCNQGLMRQEERRKLNVRTGKAWNPNISGCWWARFCSRNEQKPAATSRCTTSRASALQVHFFFPRKLHQITTNTAANSTPKCQLAPVCLSEAPWDCPQPRPRVAAKKKPNPHCTVGVSLFSHAFPCLNRPRAALHIFLPISGVRCHLCWLPVMLHLTILPLLFCFRLAYCDSSLLNSSDAVRSRPTPPQEDPGEEADESVRKAGSCRFKSWLPVAATAISPPLMWRGPLSQLRIIHRILLFGWGKNKNIKFQGAHAHGVVKAHASCAKSAGRFWKPFSPQKLVENFGVACTACHAETIKQRWKPNSTCSTSSFSLMLAHYDVTWLPNDVPAHKNGPYWEDNQIWTTISADFGIDEDEERLVIDLFRDYNSLIRPVQNVSRWENSEEICN